MSIFYKNCIISGEVDHYCLFCKEAFTKQDQLSKHIEWINHKKKLKTLTYLKKFQKNKIYKIDHIYYCEVCSEVMHNRSSLCTHVEDDRHKANIEAFSDDENEPPPESSENRRKLVERHEETEFVLLCNLALNNLQWHSIIKNNCWLCDTVVRNINELRDHITSLNHMVRLIQSKCYIYNNEISHYFRKINEEKFYCFVCEKTLPTSSLPTHWEEKEHADSLSTTSSSSTSSPPIDPKVMLVELKLFETQLPYYSVEESTCKAVCKQCKESLPLKYIKLVKHRKKHIAVSWPTDPPESQSQPRPIDYGQHRANMAKFAKQNFMRTTHGGHRAFCFLCKVHLPATKKKILEHVEGFRHQGFLQIKGHIKSYYKERMKPTKYATLSEYVEHMFPLPSKSMLIINKLHVINVLSFNLIIRIDIDKHIQKTFCYVCETYLREDEENDHINDETHQQKSKDVRVLADINNDFIRKINEEKFYCFVCEKTLPTSSLPTHWEEKEHADSLSTTSSSSTSSPPIDPKVMLVELKLFETQLPYYSVEESTCKAVCKQCKESLPLKYIKLVKHRKKHIAVSWPTDPPESQSQPRPIDYGQHRANMAKFAKQNFMRTTHGGHRAFCFLCKVHLPATKKKILEHVEGFRHQGFLQIKGHIKSYYKERMKPTKYATLSEYVEHMFPLPSKSMLIINKLHVINVLSFNLIIRIDIDKHIQKTFCYVCETYLREDEENDHINDETHQQKSKDVRVLADINNDFIRKVREFEYHCGYCNELWSSYKGIGNHVSRKKHKLARKYRVLPQGYSKILENNVTEAQLEKIVDHFHQNLEKV